jgi:hypothetical protein
MVESKKWYLSKGFWLGVVIAAGGIAEYIANLPPEASIPAIVSGVMVIIVRLVTNQPITK